MLNIRGETTIMSQRVACSSSAIWYFLTVEFLIGAFLSGLLAFLAVLKSLLPKPPRDLTGDVVLVAGASSSLGESLAEEFARNGCSLVCLDDSSTSLQETATRLKDKYHSVTEVSPRHRKDDSSRCRSTISAYECNLLEKDDVRRTAQKVKEDFGKVDVLVTCVGGTNQDIFDTASRTLMSHFWVVLSFLPIMLYRDRAHIVGVTPVASSSDNYHGSRAAIASLMESLCQQLSNHCSHLTFLAFAPIAECSTLKESEEQAARNIVQAVRTDHCSLNSSWVPRLFYQISCMVYNGITLLTQWIYSQGYD